jgi:RNA ligase (TIGR02306 family)
MTRKLARIVRIDSVTPIVGADAIECAHVGGWSVVIKKHEYQAGDSAVYFEIDSFLPEGNPAWQFLVDKSSRNYLGARGHVLRSIKLRGQVSQGFLLQLDVLREAGVQSESLLIDRDVSAQLGVLKYEAPVPASLAGVARGPFPWRVPKTDQERIQNMDAQLAEWSCDPHLTWEVTEKLEGSSCTFAWLYGELHVCSRNLDLLETEDNTLWKVAKELLIAEKCAAQFAYRNLALQGEIVGFGIQANIYSMRAQKFFLFDIYDVDQSRFLSPSERQIVANALALEQVPILESAFQLPADISRLQTDALIAQADGVSALQAVQLREGLVFKANEKSLSFKIVSNKYLLQNRDV